MVHEGVTAGGIEWSIHGEGPPTHHLLGRRRYAASINGCSSRPEACVCSALLTAACPARIKREVAGVLPGADTNKLLIVPTCQHAAMDLVQTGARVDQEKDDLLEKFMAWAQAVIQPLIDAGHYSDYIDPCSGLPMVHKEGQIVYPEVEALSMLKGFKTSNAGCCKVLLHPRWGSAVYPATLFTTAPVEELLAAIGAADDKLSAA